MKYLQEYKLYEFLANNSQFKKLITESGTNPLFHALNVSYAKKALEENKLGGYSHQRSWEGGIRYKDDHPKYEESDYIRGISTTRDIEYASKFNQIIFVFDSDKIKQKYKVLPYNWGYLIGKGYKQKSIKREREEFIVTGHSYLKDVEKDEDDYFEDDNMKSRNLNIQISKMLEKPKGYIEPLNKYLIGFFISGRLYDLMSEENKKYFENHKKYLGVYTDYDWIEKNKNLSFKDKLKNIFNK